MRPGHAVFIQALKAAARERGVHYEDMNSGLDRVVENGWLERNEAAEGKPPVGAAHPNIAPANGHSMNAPHFHVGDNSQVF
jgi:hypothetical protein